MAVVIIMAIFCSFKVLTAVLRLRMSLHHWGVDFIGQMHDALDDLIDFSQFKFDTI